MSRVTCPNCHGLKFVPAHSFRSLQREIDQRERFVYRRLDHRPADPELMDLTHFMHGEPARLLACASCGVIVRDEQILSSYESDLYDPAMMTHLYPRYLEAFRKKERFRELLSPHAEVAEIGSHLGAFLQAAEEWQLRPTGFDVGKDTTGFALKQGVRVRRGSFEDTRVTPRSLEAVFIWNCFEQLENPSATLRASYAALQRHGLIVVRVPNFWFYERNRNQNLVLAYNNLLGFPYLIGYTPWSLGSVLRGHGFEPVAGLNTTLITIPFPTITPQIKRETAVVYSPYRRARFDLPMEMTSPWMEIMARKID